MKGKKTLPKKHAISQIFEMPACWERIVDINTILKMYH